MFSLFDKYFSICDIARSDTQFVSEARRRLRRKENFYHRHHHQLFILLVALLDQYFIESLSLCFLLLLLLLLLFHLFFSNLHLRLNFYLRDITLSPEGECLCKLPLTLPPYVLSTNLQLIIDSIASLNSHTSRLSSVIAAAMCIASKLSFDRFSKTLTSIEHNDGFVRCGIHHSQVVSVDLITVKGASCHLFFPVFQE